MASRQLGSNYCLLTLSPADGAPLPAMMPGQFVQVAVDTPGVFLRRPISIHDVDTARRELKLLVRRAGRGTAALIDMPVGRVINVVLPLGNSFTTSFGFSQQLLLVGGGVGVAPLLYLGRYLSENGLKPRFLIGARSESDLLLLDEFRAVGPVDVCTEDGSSGVKGLVTDHPILQMNHDHIFCCGPTPMMKAVAALARTKGISCEVSLENMMACGLGACLCCVEKTVKGNVCVCTDGPVFDINELTW